MISRVGLKMDKASSFWNRMLKKT